MPIDLHLFSTPGDGRPDDIHWIVEACRPYLEKKADARLAYLPLGLLYAGQTVEQTRHAFRGLARLEALDAEQMELPAMQAVLRGAAAAYIPGGNTFLLNHRLHLSQLFAPLRRKLEAGLPLAAFSAGTVLCGPDILTSNDLNMLPTTHFDGLNLTPFNFSVHYGDDPGRDQRLADYRAFHDHPLLLMEDGAYVRLRGREATLVRGQAWLWRAGRDKERLKPGARIPALEEPHG